MSGNWWSRGASPKHKKERSADIPDTIRDWELDKGGWRYDEHNTGYNLTWEQLLEFEAKNLSIVKDEDFNKWFKEFRKTQGITSRSYAGGLSKAWDTEWDDTPHKKGKYLSSWWASDTYKGFSASNETATRLALALQAVRTTVRVVDNTVPPLVVSWDKGDNSFTDFKNGRIVINPGPVKDTKTETGEAIDITTGFALHEASHSEYSRGPYETITKPTELAPLQIAGMLLNFVEDIRIEAKTTEEFPGFAGYFEASLKWAWVRSKGHIPPKWGPKVWDKMNAILAIIRFPDGPSVLTDSSFAPEIPWWTNWRDEYLAGKVDSRTTIQRGIDRLAEDPDTKKELDEMVEQEEAAKKAGELLKDLVERLMKEAAKKMGIDACVNDVGRESLGEHMGTEVERLVSEELNVEHPFIKMNSGHGNHQLYITHPLEDERSKRAYIGKPKPVLSRLKAALLFRQELPRFTTRLLKRGGLDEEELWRWADHDYRVFNEEVIAARPQVQMSLLVDLSGSMYGEKLKSAQELAQLFIWALKDMDGVDTKVFGHTGDFSARTGSVDLYRLWEPGEPLTRLGLINTLYHGNNYDGHAIAWCVKEVMARGGPDEQRIIIVLSDGYPSGIAYGGSPGIEHVRQVTQWADKNGVQVIQIAIDEAVEPERQGRMFKQFIQYTGLDDLPRQLTRLLAKLT